jgi:hypothetical protein
LSFYVSGAEDFVKASTPKDCMCTTCIIECVVEILAALQYLSPRVQLQQVAQSMFKAISDVPVVVDWLRRSVCRVGVITALNMVLANYTEGLDLAEVTAGFPSETGEFNVAEVLKIMDQVHPYVDRVLAIADLDAHQARVMVPKDLGDDQRIEVAGLPYRSALRCS